MNQRELMARSLDSYLKSGLSRRTLMRASLAAGGLAAMAPFAAAATGGGRRTIDRAANQEPAWAEAPVKFVWVDYAEPTTIDPALVVDTNSFAVCVKTQTR